MIGKLQALSALRGHAAIIFNGNAARNLDAALDGKRIGTVIRL
jgi:isopentenyl phosphate kinase